MGFSQSCSADFGKINGIRGSSLALGLLWMHNGNVTDAGKHPNKGQLEFTAPSSGYGTDWVLVLDDASKNFAPPGSNTQ